MQCDHLRLIGMPGHFDFGKQGAWALHILSRADRMHAVRYHDQFRKAVVRLSLSEMDVFRD